MEADAERRGTENLIICVGTPPWFERSSHSR